MENSRRDKDERVILDFFDNVFTGRKDQELLEQLLEDVTTLESLFERVCSFLRNDSDTRGTTITMTNQEKIRLARYLTRVIEKGTKMPESFLGCLGRHFASFPKEVKQEAWKWIKYHHAVPSLHFPTNYQAGMEAMVPRMLPLNSMVPIHVKFLPDVVIRSHVEQDRLQVLTEPMFLPSNKVTSVFLEVHTTAGEVDPPYLTVKLEPSPQFITFQLKARRRGSHLFVMTVRLTSTGQPVATFTTQLEVLPSFISEDEVDEELHVPTIVPLYVKSTLKNDDKPSIIYKMVDEETTARLIGLLRRMFSGK